MRTSQLLRRSLANSEVITKNYTTSAASKPAYQQKLQFAHVKGTNQPPLQQKTIAQEFLEQVNRMRGTPFLIDHQQSEKLNWEEVNYRAELFAKGLVKLGYTKGDRFTIWMPNCLEWLICFYGCAKIGVIVVNLNPAFRHYEIVHTLNTVHPKGVLIMPSFKHVNYIKLMQDICPEISTTDAVGHENRFKELPTVKHVITLGEEKFSGFLNFNEIFGSDSLHHADTTHQINKLGSQLHFQDYINIQYTSGTTNLPKSVGLTHYNILNNGYFCGEGMRFTEKDRLCLPVPLFHCFGLVLGVLAAQTHGASVVLPHIGFDAESCLQSVSQYGCTAIHGVPTMFVGMLNHANFNKYDYSTLRTGIMAGSVCPEEVMRKCMNLMHLKDMTICYGMTETSPVSFQSDPTVPFEKRITSVGRIHPHVEAKVIHPETGETCKVGESGELCTRGYMRMKEYWNNPKETAKAIDKEGYMHTGDLAEIDADGYCYIVGRIKDLIIRGGENISPKEVENLLLQHPIVHDVAIIGVPDEFYGEVVGAYIIPKKGVDVSKLKPESIQEFCKKELAYYKVPAYVWFIEEFPMTASGKIQKYLLRDRSKEDKKTYTGLRKI